MTERIEMAFCCRCLAVQPCRVTRSVGMWTWRCKECGSVADEDFDDEEESNWIDMAPISEPLEAIA